MKETIKKSFIGWLVFLSTVILWAISYAAVSTVTTGQTLTADMWNNLISSVLHKSDITTLECSWWTSSTWWFYHDWIESDCWWVNKPQDFSNCIYSLIQHNWSTMTSYIISQSQWAYYNWWTASVMTVRYVCWN